MMAGGVSVRGQSGQTASWTQWGGPNRNFQVQTSGLKSQWPSSGPPVLWKRTLGDGYSSPAVEGGTIYTMYGVSGKEIATAISARTGKTIWETENPRSVQSDAARDMGNGPYATPLIAGGRVFTAGIAGRLQCLEAKTGKLIWKQDLWIDHDGTRLMYGYASSPIAFRETVIVPVGGKGKSVMAFRQEDGKPAWSRGDYRNAYSSPVLINVDGLEQLVTVMDGAVLAVNPNNGDPQWSVPFKAEYGISVSTPVWVPGNLLFVSAEYDAGSKMIRIVREGQQTKATEVWTSNRLRVHHGNVMCIDGTLYFSSGGKGSVAVLSAVDANSGKIHWQNRAVSKATFVWADKKLITLDQDGNLILAEPSPAGFKILTKAELLTNLSWTPPVLVGTKLYIRDRRSLIAVELG